MGFLPNLDSRGFIVVKSPKTKIRNKRRKKKRNGRIKWKQQKPLKQDQYHRYISSHRWAKRRRRYFATHPNWCFLCGSKEDVVLHHLTYERLGMEEDKDLMALCSFHHKEFHDSIGGSKKNMVQETFAFVAFKREEYAIEEVMKNIQ